MSATERNRVQAADNRKCDLCMTLCVLCKDVHYDDAQIHENVSGNPQREATGHRRKCTHTRSANFQLRKKEVQCGHL